MARVLFSSTMKPLTGGLESCEVEGSTIREVAARLVERFPALRAKLLKEDGALRATFIVFLDDRDIRALEREDSHVRSDSMIRIIPAIAGG